MDKLSVNLDQPLLEQQSFREYFNLDAGEAQSNLSMQGLLAATKEIIQKELCNCNLDEGELTSLSLKYCNSQGENEEINEEFYAIQWCCNSEINEPEKEMASSPTPAPTLSQSSDLPSDFLEKLTDRLSEVMVNTSIDHRLIATEVSFKSREHCKVYPDTDPTNAPLMQHPVTNDWCRAKKVCNGKAITWMDMRYCEKRERETPMENLDKQI